MMETHYYLMELWSSEIDCETKEMSGGGGWFGCLVSGGFNRFGCDMVWGWR